MEPLTETDPPTSSAATMVNNQAILKAIDELKSQETPNIAETARKYGLAKNTLWRRYNGHTVSNSEARSRSNKVLTNAQEGVLIEHINKLSARNMHPTPQMVENLVMEMTGSHVGERWVERFRKRYGNELRSCYLRNIDQSRHIADHSKHFQHYFDNVSTQVGYYAG
jgi:hypothetical protein